MKSNDRQRAVAASLPVFFGYVFLGTAFGVTLAQAGFGPLWALACSAFVYGGSLQFVMVPMMAGSTPLLTVMLTAFMVQARHLFYGISYIARFRRMGRLCPYMVFSLTDETYSVFCSLPEGESDGLLFRIALYDHLYWIAGSVLGAVLGTALPLDFTGIDFSMTALFVVICVEKGLDRKSRPALALGVGISMLMLFLLGPDRFLAPALAATAALLVLTRPVKGGAEG